ncbi:Acyl-CoA synthetase (AMP-forming)/AMP-acid ligase II [Variovorax sp. OK605]|uniref:class I adenylate-forming enzyme family protein n=1 Tax=Variovorax sp. OK605 TaxID=1855317 RepID=UPI0008E65A23|nr:class I adenylate-forming enzyme family protein [Variovorax sp. OK605]SFP57122.1 Acyl-CoA synthetase (AMP-forming)/AMP-acid ligase II [Variovorax sp. OK605]
MQIPELLSQDFGTVAQLIHAHALREPAHTALFLEGEGLGYAALDAWMDRVAAALQRDGLRPGDVVAISATTSLAYAAVFLGSVRAGVVVAPLAPDATPEGLAAMVADSGARLFFLDHGVAQSMGDVAASVSARLVALDDADHATALSAWLAPAGATPEAVTLHPEAPFNIIYSSGTTGTPKGIVMPHAFRWAQVKLFTSLGYGPDAVTLVSIPLYSNMTLSSFLPALSLGAKVVLMRKFDAGGYLALAQAHRVTHSMMVPVQFQRIMARPDFGAYDLSSFRMKSCGSAPFPAALKADVLARWPGGLTEYYGMTEGGGVCALPAHDRPDKLHTVGQPAPGHDMRVIDEEGRELPRGEIGEIVGRSGTMMVGYHNLPAKTAEAEWFDGEGRRFIRSGDTGRFDEDGYLVLLDRKKDMIISGGFNVYPVDLEAVLRGHPDVAEAAVFGIASAQWGESPMACVVLREQAAVTASALMAWANERLGKAQRLADLRVVDSLPRSDIGKVLKRQLRDTYAAAR